MYAYKVLITDFNLLWSNKWWYKSKIKCLLTHLEIMNVNAINAFIQNDSICPYTNLSNSVFSVLILNFKLEFKIKWR